MHSRLAFSGFVPHRNDLFEIKALTVYRAHEIPGSARRLSDDEAVEPGGHRLHAGENVCAKSTTPSPSFPWENNGISRRSSSKSGFSPGRMSRTSRTTSSTACSLSSMDNDSEITSNAGSRPISRACSRRMREAMPVNSRHPGVIDGVRLLAQPFFQQQALYARAQLGGGFLRERDRKDLIHRIEIRSRTVCAWKKRPHDALA